MNGSRRNTFAPGAVPLPLRYASWAVLAACGLMMFVGGWRTGVTMDEPIHVQRFNHYLASGWYLADGQVEHGSPTSHMTQQYVYGPATMLLLHTVNAAVGVEPWSAAGLSDDAYAVRHLMIALIGVLGLVAVIVIGRILFRRWDWGVLAGATLAAVPLWTGHAMFNVKDVPVATGYIYATLGLVILLRDGAPTPWRRRVTGLSIAVAGTVLAVGTRPAMWSGIALGGLLLLACRFVLSHDLGRGLRARASFAVVSDIFLIAVASWLLLLWMDPNVFRSPTDALINSIHSSSDFLGLSAPWAIVPLWVAFQMPLLLICFGLAGSVSVARRVLALRGRITATEGRWLIVGAQAFAMPVGVIITQAPVYGDLRQLLFSAPAASLLAVLGMSSLICGASTLRDRRVASMVRVAATASLVLPVAMQAMLFPYNYTFYNPLAAVAGLHANGEYYRASARELAPKIPVSGRIVCSPQVDEDGRATRAGHLFGWSDCRSDSTSPVAPYSEEFGGPSTALRPEEFWALTFNPTGETGKNCHELAGIARRTLWQHIKMARLSRCSLAFPTLPDRSLVTFRESDFFANSFPDAGWLLPSYDQTKVGIRATGRESTLVFKLSRSLGVADVELLFRTAEPATPSAAFDGEPVRVEHLDRPAGFKVLIPAALVQRSFETALPLRLRAKTASGSGFKVLSLQALPMADAGS